MASSNSQVAVETVVPTPALSTIMCPELLMAACHGNHEQVVSLLDRGCHPDAAEEAVQLPAGAGMASEAASVVIEIDDRGGAATAVCSAPAASSSWLLRCVTPEGDSTLHLVAAAGDTDGYLKSAIVIYDRDRRLLAARNRGGSTPCHRAARAGNVAMLSLLVSLARAEAEAEGGGGAGWVEAILRTRNAAGETALHEAIRAGDMRAVDVLMAADPRLARVPPEDGASPLFLAVSLCREQGSSITTTLVNIREPPLELAKQIMDADVYSADQSDKKGSFPVHIAASAGRLSAVKILITRYSGCAALRDSNGRTFLHVAVNKKRYDIVAYAYKTPVLSTILNIQDNHGNTALHLAVEVGDWWIFFSSIFEQTSRVKSTEQQARNSARTFN
ncbi:hypothetical protein BAE44_0012398 [Dichanthelium oligosanthes]|uniref:Uncharacterized protein n=1 Tax=Dichanthelium oligosanthes TaxID=888268 RepID=A0A1E5VNE7_9POAL|nr:hypothetical protein BAE44_0012398 [Dichanthelium oligosanthes]